MRILFIIGIFILCSIGTKAQNIYFDMENWHYVPVATDGTLNLSLPDKWYSTDSVTYMLKMLYPGISLNKQTFKTTDAHSGNSAVKIVTADEDILGISSTMFTNTQPIVDFAHFDPNHPGNGVVFNGGTLINERIDEISVWVKYAPVGNDVAYIGVEVVAAGKGVNGTDSVIGSADYIIDTAYNEYTQFTIPIIYTDYTTIPDHVKIYFAGSANNPHIGSTLYIDDVSIPQHSTGIQHVTEKQEVTVYPNPAQSHIHFRVKDNAAQTLSIFSATGKCLTTTNIKGNYTYDCTDLPAGNYTYTLSSGVFGKFAVVK
ncbi:MAG: T9SS type A sorting domain-containing protein [Bacteroidetes bacterium]|nr:T9SS type A sorting domain-containing protein [Bacteroidota bacterium]